MNLRAAARRGLEERARFLVGRFYFGGGGRWNGRNGKRTRMATRCLDFGVSTNCDLIASVALRF